MKDPITTFNPTAAETTTLNHTSAMDRATTLQLKESSWVMNDGIHLVVLARIERDDLDAPLYEVYNGVVGRSAHMHARTPIEGNALAVYAALDRRYYDLTDTPNPTSIHPDDVERGIKRLASKVSDMLGSSYFGTEGDGQGEEE